jgi:hypothetical protein
MRLWTSSLIVCGLMVESCAQHPAPPKSVTWNPISGTFAWREGQVKLPVGFTYQVDQGVDTLEGHFTSADGKLIIRHDIGAYAGTWARREKAFFFRENVIDDARVWVAKREWPAGKEGIRTTLVVVTFPDSGSANFFLESSKPEEVTAIDFIARSFRPTSRPAPTSPNAAKSSN